MTLVSIGFKCFAKIMKGSFVFYCSSCISFNPTSHLKEKLEYGVIKYAIKGICRERLCNELDLEALSSRRWERRLLSC